MLKQSDCTGWGATIPADDGLYHFIDAEGNHRALFPYEWIEQRWAYTCPCEECNRRRIANGIEPL